MKELKLVKTIENENGKFTMYEIGCYMIEEQFLGVNRDFRRICVRANETASKYAPEIYFDDCIFGGNEKFRIQTTSYGSLEINEFKEFIKAQNEAVEIVEILTNTFLK